MFVVESHLTKQEIFSWLRKRFTLIKKISHFSVSVQMLNVWYCYTWSIKSYALDFYHMTVFQTSFITWLKSHHHILILKYKNCWKPSWCLEIILTNITFRKQGSAFSVSKLQMTLVMTMVKNTVKSFVRQSRCHTYLTHETLQAEERVSKFYKHGKTPSYRTFTNASMRKVVLRKSLEGIDQIWDWDRVSRSFCWNCRP